MDFKHGESPLIWTQWPNFMSEPANEACSFDHVESNVTSSHLRRVFW